MPRATSHGLEHGVVAVVDAHEKYAGSRARCLTCGEVATDNYNWQPP